MQNSASGCVESAGRGIKKKDMSESKERMQDYGPRIGQEKGIGLNGPLFNLRHY